MHFGKFGQSLDSDVCPVDRKKQLLARGAITALFSPLDELRRCFPAARAARERAHQRVLEGLAKVAIEVRVDERVQGAVEVTYPEEDGHHRVWTVAGLAAQGRR